MADLVVKPKNKKEEKVVKEFLQSLDIDYTQANEDAAPYEIRSNRKTPDSISKNQFLNELREAVNEVKLIKQGKLKGRPAKDLLNEL